MSSVVCSRRGPGLPGSETTRPVRSFVIAAASIRGSARTFRPRIVTARMHGEHGLGGKIRRYLDLCSIGENEAVDFAARPQRILFDDPLVAGSCAGS